MMFESGDWVLAPRVCCLLVVGHLIGRIVVSWASLLFCISDCLLIEISILGLSKWEHGLLLLDELFIWWVGVLIVYDIMKWSSPDRILNTLSWLCASLGSSHLRFLDWFNCHKCRLFIYLIRSELSLSILDSSHINLLLNLGL